MRISLLAESEIRRLHDASLSILERVGVRVPHAETLRRFAEAGARVDVPNQHVWIPEKLVEQCLATARKQFTIYGRDRSRRAEFGVGKRNFNSSAGQAFWVDDKLCRRYATLDDVRAAARLADALPWINVVGAMADPHELPVEYRCVWVAAELLKHTSKPITFWFHDRASAVATLAGTMAQENAEILAGLCIVQLIRPGTAVCYGGIPHAFDMRTTQVIFAGPEQALMAVGMAELARFYGLPAYINVGLTDSKLPDAQAGVEAGITLACGVLAGADIFGHLGICGADQGASLSMLMLQNEIIGYLERLLRGVEIDDEHLGIEALEEGIRAGSFLGLEHTVRHFRSELWFPQLFDRRYWEAWASDGSQDLAARCQAMKDDVLRKHVPEPMDRATERAVDDLLDAAKR
jgi:trimethylamine:corrinoid methyltransferase-like protein